MGKKLKQKQRKKLKKKQEQRKKAKEAQKAKEEAIKAEEDSKKAQEEAEKANITAKIQSASTPEQKEQLIQEEILAKKETINKQIENPNNITEKVENANNLNKIDVKTITQSASLTEVKASSPEEK